jgi:hypothetical protein
LPHAGVKLGGAKHWVYTSDVETALAKAEDGLLSTSFHQEERSETESIIRRRYRSRSIQHDGFVYVLQKIDEQHGSKTPED